ncbi:MAG: hypothetical protein WB809_08805 [Thermoplasmata archaeon]
MPSSPAAARRPRHPNAGWVAGSLVILGVLAAGAYLWFSYHPW